MNDGYKQLAFAIISRSVEDYKFLIRHNRESYTSYKRGNISKKEIRAFLLSDWCNFILQNMELSGKDILSYLDRE